MTMDAKKVASGGARQLPNRRPRPEQTRRKRMDGCRETGYHVLEGCMKRIADWLEKISAGSILIGLYQNNLWAIAIGLGTLAGSVYISRRFL